MGRKRPTQPDWARMQPPAVGERAILQRLSDRGVHPAEELRLAVLNSLPAQEALARYRTKDPNSSARFKGLSTKERTAELLRQEIQGAKWEYSYALAHLRNPHAFVEEVEKGQFRITEWGLRRLALQPRGPATCEFCGLMLNPDLDGIFQWTEGWAEQRAKGGPNSVVLPQKKDRWACAECINDRRPGKGRK